MRTLLSELPHGRCPYHGAGCSGHHPQNAAFSSAGAPATDYAFEMANSTIRFGPGVTAELGADVVGVGAKRVMVFSDANIAALPGGPLARTLSSLRRAGLEPHVFTAVAIEPTEQSLFVAIAEAQRYAPDAIVAVGGGSVMDTAKAANLYLSHPKADFLDFVNAPIGKGLPVPGPVRPLFAIPTTAGTGSETSGVAIFDYAPAKAKTGIASRILKPTLGLVDPENTASAPPSVAVAAGFDVLCHALESYTALPYSQRAPRPATPQLRPAYQGSNPMSDVWAVHSLRLLAKYFVRSIADRGDVEANAAMTLAATAAGVGFGSAGVHLCHGCSYAISGLNKSYRHPGYESVSKPLVPHGISVVMGAPAIFRRTAHVCPDRHLEAARILGGENPPAVVSLAASGGSASGASPEDAGKRLAEQVTRYMHTLKVPNGLGAMGFTRQDIPALVQATLPQRRVLSLAPSAACASSDALSEIFADSMDIY
jgi:hydroxyacid-oxoacid transhydrogenase